MLLLMIPKPNQRGRKLKIQSMQIDEGQGVLREGVETRCRRGIPTSKLNPHVHRASLVRIEIEATINLVKIDEGTTCAPTRETTMHPETTPKGKIVGMMTAIVGGKGPIERFPRPSLPKSRPRELAVLGLLLDWCQTMILPRSKIQSASILTQQLKPMTHEPLIEPAARNAEAESAMIISQAIVRLRIDSMIQQTPKKISIRLTDLAIFPIQDQGMERYLRGPKSSVWW